MNVCFRLTVVAALTAATAPLAPVALRADVPAAASSEPNVLVIEPLALRNSKGAVRCLAFRSKRGFPSDRVAAFAWTSVDVVDNRAECVFRDLPPGAWAVSFIHDEDRDGELNTNFFGVPTEGYGFSRNAHGTFGPPDFADAALNYGGGELRLKLRVRY